MNPFSSTPSARSRALPWLLLSLLLLGCGPLPDTVAKAASERERADQQRVEAPGEPTTRPSGLTTRPPATDKTARRWGPTLDAIVDEYVKLGLRHVKGKARARDFEVSVHVVDLESGQEWGSRRADVARIPASNMKLLTSAAALVLLGPGQDFVTPVEAVGELRDGVLDGDLVLRASGDPIVGLHGDARVEPRLDALVDELRRSGVRRVLGDVVLDEGSFADPAPAPGWPPSNQYWQEHCALSGGFSINGSVLQALVTPDARGARARIEVHPTPHGLRSNYGVSSSGKQLKVQVGATRSAVTVKGSIPRKHQPYLAEFSHPDPVALFGSVLMSRLERGGVQVQGSLRRQRQAPAGRPVASLRSSLDDVFIPINTHSRNSVADQVLLALGNALGAAGTLEQGALVTRQALAELGVSTTGFHQADGSGLSRENRVTARQLTCLIAAVMGRDPETKRVFRGSLARNGEAGSLSERMRSEEMAGRVFAKTGWITGVSAFSGICLTLDGHELVFSILIEYPPELGGLNTKCFKPMQDALITSLVTGKP